MTTVAAQFAAIKSANPRLRRTSPVAITHSGGQRTIRNCILCGAWHTEATRYRGQTKHMLDFIRTHNAGECLAEVASA